MPIELKIKAIQALTGLNGIADDLQGQKFRRDMLRATLLVLRDSKKNAPVDTGRLRSGLNSSVEQLSFFGRGVSGVIGVGSNVEYAAAMERQVHYLENALEDNEARIVNILGTSVSTIIKSNGF
jgi:hypothetical protein